MCQVVLKKPSVKEGKLEINMFATIANELSWTVDSIKLCDVALFCEFNFI